MERYRSPSLVHFGHDTLRLSTLFISAATLHHAPATASRDSSKALQGAREHMRNEPKRTDALLKPKNGRLISNTTLSSREFEEYFIEMSSLLPLYQNSEFIIDVWKDVR